MTKWVALLRGINVGGHKKVPMAKLKKLLGDMGFINIETYLASGNAVFEAKEENPAVIKKGIEEGIEAEFGFPVNTIILRVQDLEKIVRDDPFKDIQVQKETRLYVTFLSDPPGKKLPHPQDNSFRILSAAGTALFSVLDLSQGKTTQAMNILEKTFGKNITTRNWNTILKMIK